MADEFDKELDNERHNSISNVLQEHNNKINSHESRLQDMEKSNVRLDEVVRQNITQANMFMQNIDKLSDKMVIAIDKLTDTVTGVKNTQQEQLIDSLKARQILNDKITENQYKPDAARWKVLVSVVITSIVGLIFAGIQLRWFN